MTINYELEFSVGSVTGRLIGISPNFSHSEDKSTYYEHNHAGIELHYIKEGSCTFICDKKLVSLEAGDTFLIPPRKYHRVMQHSENIDKISMLIEILPLRKDFLEGDKSFYEAFSIDSPTVITKKPPTLTDLLDRIRALTLSDDTRGYIHREKLRASCALLAIELYSEMARDEKIGDGEGMRHEFSEKYIIDTFMAIKFMSNSAGKDLAEELHVSQRQLSRTLKKIYGMNYREKLKEIRVEIATNFLTTTKKPVSEIAEILGYSTAAAFCKFYKSATGKSPSEVRKSVAE